MGCSHQSLERLLAFEVQKNDFVQVLNLNRAHWITIGSSKGEVNVYDSLPSVDVSKRVKEQIACICNSAEDFISLTIKNVQIQQGSSDCGLFALAFATSLCAGENPSEINYIQNLFCGHLVQCLQDKIMKPFPRRARKRIDKGVYNTFKYAIYCSCRQPKDTGRMIECEVCQKWFHEDSVVVPLDVWKSDNLSWKCNVCN